MAARARPFSRALAESGEPQKFWRPRRWGRNTVIESVCLCDPALVVGYMYIVHRQHRTRRVLLPSCYHMIPRPLICEQVVNSEASSRSVALAYGITTVLRPSKNTSMGQSLVETTCCMTDEWPRPHGFFLSTLEVKMNKHAASSVSASLCSCHDLHKGLYDGQASHQSGKAEGTLLGFLHA